MFPAFWFLSEFWQSFSHLNLRLSIKIKSMRIFLSYGRKINENQEFSVNDDPEQRSEKIVQHFNKSQIKKNEHFAWNESFNLIWNLKLLFSLHLYECSKKICQIV